MTLTVPQSGRTAGRTANLAGAVAAPQDGRIVEQAGQTLLRVGSALEADRLSRAGQQLQLDMTRDLNSLRLEAEQIGDPDQIDAFWQTRSAELQQGYAERVDPALRSRFAMDWQQLSDRHAFALGQRALGLRRSEREAGWLAYAQETVNAGAAMDPETRATFVGMGNDRIDRLVADGTISPEEGERRKQAYARDMDEAAAIRLINEDPAGFLSVLDAGGLDGLPAVDRERYRAAAQRDLDKQADSAAREQDRAVGERLSRIATISDPGRLTIADREWLDSPEAAAHPDFARTQAGLSLAEEAPGWRNLPPQELRDMLAQESQRPVEAGWQEERAELLQAQIAAHETGLSRDPVAHAADQGMAVPDLGTFDPAAPAALASALRDRRDAVARIGQAGWDTGGAILTEPERAALRDAADVGADPRDRLSLAGALVAGLGDDAPALVRDITGGDAVLEQATWLLAEGAPAATAADMLAGARALADKSVTGPSPGDFADAFRDLTEDRFSDYPGYAGRVRAAAIALYTAGTPIDDDGQVDERRFEAAIQRALGGAPEPRGQRGGLAEIRGAPVPLPVGIEAGAVDAALDRAAAALEQKPMSAGSTALTAPDLSALAAASLTGAPPDFGQAPQEADTFLGRPRGSDDIRDLFEAYQVEEFWPDGQPRDEYILQRQRGGRWVALRDTNGQVYRFSLKQLVEATR